MEEKLNILLASYQIHYQNLRSLHWNIKGQNFFDLHAKYEELYTRTQIIVDDIAERILAIGFHPLSSLKEYLSGSIITENKVINNGKEGITYIFSAQQKLLILEKSIVDEFLDKNMSDEGTTALMSDLIREKEKTNWMFQAWLND